MRDLRVELGTIASSRQIPALDGIRGLAIIWVVLHNSTAMPMGPSNRWLHVLPWLASRGWIGVQLFFALSGFLITLGLLNSQGASHYFGTSTRNTLCASCRSITRYCSYFS
jgi:peptidoglycan/LPS O-acetylase OafA/YrhL